MSDKHRIMLAEAMGFMFEGNVVTWPDDNATHWATWKLKWNPFTDANDDYAVLEWARKQGDEFWQAFKNYFMDVRADWNIWNYETGLFARAAVAVLAGGIMGDDTTKQEQK